MRRGGGKLKFQLDKRSHFLGMQTTPRLIFHVYNGVLTILTRISEIGWPISETPTVKPVPSHLQPFCQPRPAPPGTNNFTPLPVIWQTDYGQAKALVVRVVAACGREDLARSLADEHRYLEGTVGLCQEAEIREVRELLNYTYEYIMIPTLA